MSKIVSGIRQSKITKGGGGDLFGQSRRERVKGVCASNIKKIIVI